MFDPNATPEATDPDLAELLRMLTGKETGQPGAELNEEDVDPAFASLIEALAGQQDDAADPSYGGFTEGASAMPHPDDAKPPRKSF